MSERIVPEVVRRARVARNLTQRELADKLGVGQQWVAWLEQPGHLVTAEVMERVAKALGATVAELLEEYERSLDVPTMERDYRPGDPPRETFEPPGPARVAQLERLLKAAGGNRSAVARALGVTRQAIGQAWAVIAKAGEDSA